MSEEIIIGIEYDGMSIKIGDDYYDIPQEFPDLAAANIKNAILHLRPDLYGSINIEEVC
jgi:hypothetical protein